jgi:hypothetical protein
MITHDDLNALSNAASCAGFEVSANDLELNTIYAGAYHIQSPLPRGKAAIYIFKYFDEYLKVGKVNENSNARYQYQHYLTKNIKSCLAKSLLKDTEYSALLGDEDPGAWLRSNTERFNILIPVSLGKKFVHFAEAFFILRCNPRFEDKRA